MAGRGVSAAKPWRPVEGGITAPRGFLASGVAAGVKPGSTKKDCALVVSETAAAAAGTFTTNRFKAPPVAYTERVCAGGAARAIFANSGNANACTGERGAADARAIAGEVGKGIGAGADAVCVLSTGVIGVPLPMDRIGQGIAGCLAGLSPAGGHDAALAIMTTDTVPKEFAVEVPLRAGTVRIGAIAKGAGMICPNMATMFCFITTDARIDAAPLRALVREAVGVSFNRICIDNDMSTSDAVVCLANGAVALPPVTDAPEDLECFGGAVTAVCQEMARRLVRDGEGATKFVEIQVGGAASDAEAQKAARAIATSQLCKTAFYGEDPNWGRIACAAGYSGAVLDPNRLDIWLDDVQVMAGGMPTAFDEAKAAACMKQSEFRIRLEMNEGSGAAVFWTSDLSHRYVEINADYRT